MGHTSTGEPAATTTPAPPAAGQPLEYPRILFDETQRARQWWLWAVVAIASAVPFALLLRAGYLYPRMRPMVPLMLLPATLPLLVLTAIRLRVSVTSSELVIRHFPFRRRYPIGDIATWEATEYRPIREFGGWGIKWSLKDSTTAYTVYGTGGVRVVTVKGKKLLIGTQRPADLAAAIAEAKGTRPSAMAGDARPG